MQSFPKLLASVSVAVLQVLKLYFYESRWRCTYLSGVGSNCGLGGPKYSGTMNLTIITMTDKQAHA